MKTTFKRYILLLIVIFLAAILTACDPSCYPYQSANRVEIINNTPYIIVSDRLSMGLGCPPPREDRYFVSNDSGVTWLEAVSLPGEIPAASELPENRPIVACVPTNKSICFRAEGKARIEMTQDGGQTWQIDWQQPLGRKKYMDHAPAILPLAHVEADTVPYDLGIIESNEKYTVIVAMGNQGVLVRSNAGIWDRYALPSGGEFPASAAPLPYFAASFVDAQRSLRLEFIWIGLAAVALFFILSFQGWYYIHTHTEDRFRYKNWRAYLPFFSVFIVMTFFLLVAVNIIDLSRTSAPFWNRVYEFINGISLEYYCFVPVFGLVLSWLFIVMLTKSRNTGLKAALAPLGFSILFIIGLVSPFFLWAFGLILIYEIALALSIILGVIIVKNGFRKEKKLAISAMQPKGVAKEGDL